LGFDWICGFDFDNWMASKGEVMIYCFICDECFETKELHRSIEKRNDLVKCQCGKDMRRDIQAEQGGHRAINDTYPFASYALGIDPSEVAEHTAKDIANGVQTEYNGDGEPIFRDKSHRKKYCESYGYYDRNAGYGDPKPVNR